MTLRPYIASFLAALLGGAAVQAQDSQSIVVYGASGSIGGLIVNEALERGHSVIGVSRSPDRLTVEHPNFTPCRAMFRTWSPFRLPQVASAADAVVGFSVQGRRGRLRSGKSTHAWREARAAAALDGYGPGRT